MRLVRSAKSARSLTSKFLTPVAMRLTSASLLVLLPAALLAQTAEPKRPQLYANADTNDAKVYLDFGLDNLTRKPEVAADAFYWSSRLNPNSGEALYGRRVALLLTDRRRLVRYWSGQRSTLRMKEIQHIDSLYFHALTLNPFLYENLDQHLFRAVIDEFAKEESRASGSSSLEISYLVERWLSQAGDGMRAWRAYTDGRFPEALALYARAINGARYKYGLRSMRGRLFYQLAAYDSALAELTLAVEEMRKRDAKDFVYVYESKALYEHTAGMAHERLGDTAKARAAYARALQEDLAYSPAHVRLGYMALDAKDTTSALSEFDLAVQLRPEDSGLRHQYGHLLALVGKHTEALEQLDKSIAQNKWYAAPHFVRGASLEALNRKPEALQAYRSFLVLASRQDPRRDEATRRVAALSQGD
jgi:predicted negative regulator of RcsB-dependent stress response